MGLCDHTHRNNHVDAVSDNTVDIEEPEMDNLLQSGMFKNSKVTETNPCLKNISDTQNKNNNKTTSSFPDCSLSRTGESISKILTLISIITCLLSVAITIAILVNGNQDTEQLLKQAEALPHEICIQCIKLIGNQLTQVEANSLISKLRTHIDNGIQMCCAQNAEQISALLEATTREQVFQEVSKPQTSDLNLKFTPASVHKGLLPGNDSELSLQEPIFNDGSEHFLLRFNKTFNDPLTEHVRGVHVLDTALEINYTGLYYVYLSVHMDSNFPQPAGLFRYQHWYQYVHRTSPNSPANTGILLQTSCTAFNGTDYQETAFAGGQFYLSKGDHIEVCISGQGLVQYKKESTYLGLFMLESSLEGRDEYFSENSTK